MPVAIVKDAHRELGGDPAKWNFATYPNYGQDKDVAYLYANKGYVRYFVTGQFWFKLTPRNVPILNQLLGRQLRVRDLGNQQKLFGYLTHLDRLLLPQGAVMDDRLLNSVMDWVPTIWKGREKQLETFRRLCHRPITSTRGNDIVITYNTFLAENSVLRCTVHAKAGKWLELTSIDWVETYPAGTFPYPMIEY